ncbi:Zinc finger and BTB domain-containing protein 46, partial [Stegodyphus mimosarum]
MNRIFCVMVIRFERLVECNRYIMDPVMLKRLTAYSAIPSPVHRRFKCSFCPYCTDISTNLKNHILTHTGERKYRCDVCGMRFTLKHHLKKHTQLHL